LIFILYNVDYSYCIHAVFFKRNKGLEEAFLKRTSALVRKGEAIRLKFANFIYLPINMGRIC
jgi:hypothetical protein